MSNADNGVRPRASFDRRRFLLGSAAGLVAASSFNIRRAHAAGPLKLGVLLPRSGLLAMIGQSCQRGADLALPFMKDSGHAIELIHADTESNPDMARTQAEKLIREGAHMLMGCFDSASTAAVAQVAEQKGIPFVINIGADPKITEQGYKYVFRNFPTSYMLGVNGLSMYKEIFATSGHTPKKAVLMHINDSFGMSMLKGVTALAPKLNLPFEIAETIAYDPKARDLSIEVAKAKASGADLVMTVTRLNDAILLVREMVKQRFEPSAIISPGSPGMYERQFGKTLGKYAEYCITNVPWADPTQDLTKSAQAQFEKLHPNEDFDLNVGFTFEAVMIAADAATRSGSLAPDDLTAALRATSITKRVMLGGEIRFGDKGQNPNQASAAVQVLDGHPTVVLPKAAAQKGLVNPMPAFSART